MAYYLTIKEKNNYKALDITSLEEFIRFSKFKNASYSLDEIDKLTSKFNNESEFKKRLFEKGIINREEITKKIEIRIKLSGKLKIVHYGLIYREEAKYLDIQYLKSKILSFQNDRGFLNKLLNYYRGSHEQESLRQIAALLSGYAGSDLNMYASLNQFINDEIFNKNYQTGEVTLKYKSLHDLAMFVCNYERNSGTQTLTEKDDRIKELEALKQELIKAKEVQEPIQVKKRTRKLRKEIDGQTSFF